VVELEAVAQGKGREELGEDGQLVYVVVLSIGRCIFASSEAKWFSSPLVGLLSASDGSYACAESGRRGW
jgi:hypothetical protein